jgi:hypothetical protein
MLLSSDIRHGRHCVFALHVHLLFVTKYRRKVFDGDAIQRLKVMFEKVCTDFEAQLVERNASGLILRNSIGTMPCGRRLPLPPVVAGHRWASSSNTLSNKRPRFNPPYIPALKDRGFTARLVKAEAGDASLSAILRVSDEIKRLVQVVDEILGLDGKSVGNEVLPRR